MEGRTFLLLVPRRTRLAKQWAFLVVLALGSVCSAQCQVEYGGLCSANYPCCDRSLFCGRHAGSCSGNETSFRCVQGGGFQPRDVVNRVMRFSFVASLRFDCAVERSLLLGRMRQIFPQPRWFLQGDSLVSHSSAVHFLIASDYLAALQPIERAFDIHRLLPSKSLSIRRSWSSLEEALRERERLNVALVSVRKSSTQSRELLDAIDDVNFAMIRIVVEETLSAQCKSTSGDFYVHATSLPSSTVRFVSSFTPDDEGAAQE